jgi:benzylsuccinate CoA-transferase BbsE subunit
VLLMAGGVAANRFWDNTAGWLEKRGAPGAARLREKRWWDRDFLTTPEAQTEFRAVFEPFAQARGKMDLYLDGQAHRVPICPVSRPADILGMKQLAHRGFFVDLPHPASGRVLRAPGAPYRLSVTPWRPPGPAPRLGQHTTELLA